MLALAFIGDLSMGRPTDHSHRTAWLAARLAAEDGGTDRDCQSAHDVSLLRWSGCTANAAGFDQLLGDDVAGRDALFEMTLPINAERAAAIVPLAEIHCEVSGEIASQLGMDDQVEAGLRNIFETWDGRGNPGRLRADDVPPVVYHVALASDLEILSRARGLEAALEKIASLSDEKYPAPLVQRLQRTAPQWLATLDENQPQGPTQDLTLVGRDVPLELIADVADLKLPWLAGQSRQVAACAAATAAQLGLDANTQALLQRAGLIHAIGRAALPNHLWERTGRLTAADRERVRLMPYWTFRAASHIPVLKAEADLASYAYERLDGSGHFRSLSAAALTVPHRIIATAVALVALRSPRPWRPAFDAAGAAQVLRDEAAQGRFDAEVVEAALAALAGSRPRTPAKAAISLSAREADVLRRISLGESNKEVARVLEISPSTVRTHIESVFRKLECSTRAAATLKAFTLGLI
ncbi:LuxR C-terminal-related transcriptional regulator [Paucibacter sp. R3-3]|uniref:LuxR C-terminal-related transcriptional regulator n=1 Tax=Roseateles agri TaxID=3098619 RepID=A0ABU5DLY9_9BURK|nr:HD domain-containing phosphohydrolase [Paucibacter sp. R3-3]MDY0747319.1 LuxR C-terminal-related transcriptional regulator [Paucibacter sp. R3-3]